MVPSCRQPAVPGPYFVTSADGLVPQPDAQGPWSAEMLHGRLLGGLAARAVEAVAGHPDLVPCRLTVDLFRPAGFAPAVVTTDVVRDGRRIRVVDASVVVGGHVGGRASAVLLRRGEVPPGRVWQPERWTVPHPEDVAEDLAGNPRDTPWQWRTIEGGFGTGERTRQWSRETASLVDDEVVSPFVRAALSADAASPLANASDDGLHFINADYTLVMAREPVGEWVGLEAAEHLAAGGVAVGTCTLYDLEGPFGTSVTTALANPPLQMES